MMKELRMLVLYWMLQCYFVNYIQSEQPPHFLVAGMSNNLSSVCMIDYKESEVAFKLQLVNTGCDQATQKDSVVNTTWNFYPLSNQNGYIVNRTALYSMTEDGLYSPNLKRDGDRWDINLYAVQVIVSMEEGDGSRVHKLNGYLNIGCVKDPDDPACRTKRYDTIRNMLFHNKFQRVEEGQKVLPLLCKTTKSVYKASVSVELEVSVNRGAAVNYAVHDLAHAGIYIGGQSSLVFKLQATGDAYILLQEVYHNYSVNSTEIVLGGKSNTISEIRNQSQGVAMAKYEERNIVSVAEYRSFWISWTGNNIQVGKGELPFDEQILSWSRVSHKMNYVSIGAGIGAWGDWKFSANICMQKPVKAQCTDSDQKVWYYNPFLSFCEETTCVNDANCFVTEEACDKVCSGTPLLRSIRSMEDDIKVDTEVVMKIRCTRNCKEEKNPSRPVAFRVDCEDCQSSMVTEYQWTVKNCEELNITSCYGTQTNTTLNQTSTEACFIKNKSNATIYGIFVQVNFKDGKQAEASMLFQYLPVPTLGSCAISPVMGYSLMTDFNITCTGFTVPEGYNFDYRMRSNVNNTFCKGSLFYKGVNSTVNKIKLQPGDSTNNYTLYILVKARLGFGAFVISSTKIQVRPADANTDSEESVIDVVKDLIDVTDTGKQSLISDLLTANRSDEAVQYLSLISSSINTDTEANKTDEKTKIRTAVVTSLEKVTVDSYDTVTALTSVLNEATQQGDELSEETQDKASDMYDNLASNLDEYQGTSTKEELTESVGEILSGVTNLLELKVDKGKNKLSQNVSDGNESEQEMEKVKEGTGKLLNTVDKLSGTLLSQKVPGEAPTVLVTATMSVSVEKQEASSLGGHTLSSGNDSTSFVFPSDMSGINTENEEFGIQMIHMKNNPYIWDKSAQSVNMDVLSIDLKRDNGSSVKVDNMTEPLKISLQSPDTSEPENSSLILHLVKQDSNVTFKWSESNMMTFNFTVQQSVTTMVQFIPITNLRKLKVYISNIEKPSFQNISDHGLLYPDDIKVLNTEFSDFKMTNISTISQNISQIFISYKNTSSNYTGVHFVAITVDLEDDSTNEDLGALDPDCIGEENVSDCESTIEIVLKVKTKTLSCTYWDISLQEWKSEGCEVSPFSTSEVLECLCTHMTSFAGGVFVLPNFVDPIADAELFLTFFDNPVVVTAVLVIWMLYFFIIHWARQADKLDQEKVGVIAVDGCDMVNGYVYLMCVVTGWWSEAGTTSNVFFHITGSNGSSKRVKLSTSLRQCFQTGYEDWFLLTTEESLGDIEDVTLWHDNSGESPHWFLSQVYVKDLKAKKSWTFIYNDWLAVDRGYLLRTTTTISAVSEDDLKNQQKHNFVTKTTQDLRNTHIWISIFSKPARSTFTRVQRLTCALSLLLCTMLTNIMFYGIPTDDPDDQVSPRGEFAISLSAIVIGIQSSLIMFPVNIIVMQMFLKLKQKPVKHASSEESISVLKTLHNFAYMTSNAIIGKFMRGQDSSSKYMADSSPVDSITKKTKIDVDAHSSTSTSLNSENHSLNASTMASCSESDSLLSLISTKASLPSVTSPSVTILSEEKQTGKILPWWFLYIAWCLVLGISMICSFFVMLYGLKYGYQTSVEWLVSFFTGFSQSAFVTQPLKVLVVAIIITLIFKKAVEFEEFGPEVRLDCDEEFEKSVNEHIESHVQYSQPLSTRLLQQIKERVQLEWLMNITIRDIGLYFIYMTVVCIVVHGHRDVKQAYYNSLALEDVLINPGCINPNHCFFFEKVDNVEYFYQFLYDVAIPNLIDMSIADHDYATPGSNHFLIGPWRLRQLRVKTDSCGVAENDLYTQFNMNIPECSGPYWFGDEENDDYNMSWSNPLYNSQNQDPPSPWIYQSAWQLKTIPFKGRLATYSGGGYIVTMPSNTSLHEGTIRDTWNSDWIDERTRAVFLEFNLYNANANLFSVVLILFEFSNSGAVIPFHQIFSTKLYHYSNDFGVFVAVCEFLFLIFNISFVYIEWKKFSKLGKQIYFEDFWSYVEIIQIVLSFAAVGLFFQRLVFVDSIMKKFRKVHGESFVSFYTAISWDLILGYVMAFLVAIVTLKAAKLLRFNKRTYMIADSISHVKGMLVSFSVMTVLLFIAFSMFARFAFGKVLYEYRDFMSSGITIFNFSLGVSDLPGLTEANRVLGPIFYALFIFFAMFVFMTVFVAIINFGITESKSLFEQRKNKFELLEYILIKLKALANIK